MVNDSPDRWWYTTSLKAGILKRWSIWHNRRKPWSKIEKPKELLIVISMHSHCLPTSSWYGWVLIGEKYKPCKNHNRNLELIFLFLMWKKPWSAFLNWAAVICVCWTFCSLISDTLTCLMPSQVLLVLRNVLHSMWWAQFSGRITEWIPNEPSWQVPNSDELQAS